MGVAVRGKTEGLLNSYSLLLSIWSTIYSVKLRSTNINTFP